MKRTALLSSLLLAGGLVATWHFVFRPSSRDAAPVAAAPASSGQTAECCLVNSQNAALSPSAASSAFLTAVPLSQDVLWATAPSAPPFAAFHEWTERYSAAASAEKIPLIAEGERLAAERRTAMKTLIRRAPGRALELTVPEAVRRALPASIASQLEERIDARGDLKVTAVGLAAENHTAPADTEFTRRKAVLEDGRTFRAYVYDRRETQPTRWNVPLHGIALDGKMAVSQWPGRVLEPVEAADAKKSLTGEPLCPSSQLPSSANGTEVAVKVGAGTQFYCGPGHANSSLQAAAAAETALPPGFGARQQAKVNAASGGAGTTVPISLPSADASWTTGTKRIGIVRANFHGSNYHNMTYQECVDSIASMGGSWDDWSYSRCTVRTIGSTGSFVTPVMNLEDFASSYTEDEIDDIWDDAVDWADENGRDSDTYDFLIVVAGNAPIQNEAEDAVVWWGGLGRVGEGLSFLRTKDVAGTASVGLHELGHNLGLLHSSNLWTTPQLIGTIFGLDIYQYGEEYGDRYDKMGRSGEDYNARYKNWLHWLDNGNFPVAATDGVYTLREHDLEERSGIRGLQAPFSVVGSVLGQDSLFVEYRLSDPSNPLLAFGAQIRLGESHSPKTWLLDASPETANHEPGDPADKSGNLDSPLLPGRTFSYTQYSLPVHITNLSADPGAGKLTVEIQRGTPSGNAAPNGSIVSSSPTGATNQKVIFTADVTDADGDEMAFFWQISGMGPFENSKSLAVTFDTSSTKSIKCIVSDKHGGVRTLTKSFSIVPNQPPSIAPVSDQKIKEDASLYLVFTVSDPTTPAASLSVSASVDNTSLFPAGSIETGSLGGGSRRLSMTPAANKHGVATVTLSVSDGTKTGFEQFKITVEPVTPGTVLIASGTSWRYWDSSTAPFAEWNQRGYNDTGWDLGTSRFVYGQGALVPAGWTSLGGAIGSRTTTYYRRAFSIPSPPAGTLTLRLLCDDAAVVYFNGVEVFRQNMPEGTIKANTKAESSVEGSDESAWTLIPLSLANVNPGVSNTIAVEVHDAMNAGRGAGDVSFDAELALLDAPEVSSFTFRGASSPEDTVAGPYAFTAADSESPSGGVIITAESSNQALVLDSSFVFGFNIFTGQRTIKCTPQPDANGTTEVTVKVSDGSSETWRTFDLTITPVNDAPVITPIADAVSALGELPPLVEITLSDVDSDVQNVTVTATSSNQSFMPDAGIQVLPGLSPDKRWLRLKPANGIAAQANITVTANDGSAQASDTFIFRVRMAFTAATTDISLVRSGESWRYWTEALPTNPKDGQPIDWTAEDVDDRAWQSGISQLGYGNDGESTVVSSLPRRVTTYFRKKFTVADPSAISSLNFRLLRDDGAAVFLNGQRIILSNLPRAIIGPGTLAEDDITGAAEDAWIHSSQNVSLLKAGVNVIAVEVHQSAMPTSLAPGDLSFDLELDGVPATPGAEDALITMEDSWDYWDQKSYPDNTAWKLSNFSTSGWKRGLARLGYGIGGESTIVNGVGNAGFMNPSVLFRKVFDVADPAIYSALHLYVQREDGIAVHLNGTRVLIDNLDPSGTIGDFALHEIAPADHLKWHHFMIDPKKLIIGRNLIAAEVHQASNLGTDLGFDLQLIGVLKSQPPSLFIRDLGEQTELSWPAAYNGWSLQGSPSLPGSWTSLPELPLLDGAWVYVITPKALPQRFFRLVKP